MAVHTSWGVPVVGSKASGVRAGRLHDQLGVRSAAGGGNTHPRIFYLRHGKKKEIGHGFLLGPNDGIIVSELKPHKFRVRISMLYTKRFHLVFSVFLLTYSQVTQAAKKRVWKGFNPWMERGPPKADKEPHRNLRRFQECEVCGETKE